MSEAKDVDAYIASAPQEVQQKLVAMRRLIRTIAPEAEEKMSYGMPFYSYKGRLCYFATAKYHIGLYIPPPIIPDHAAALKQYVTSKSAVQFPLTEAMPFPLIERLVKARMKWNEEQLQMK